MAACCVCSIDLTSFTTASTLTVRSAKWLRHFFFEPHVCRASSSLTYLCGRQAATSAFETPGVLVEACGSKTLHSATFLLFECIVRGHQVCRVCSSRQSAVLAPETPTSQSLASPCKLLASAVCQCWVQWTVCCALRQDLQDCSSTGQEDKIIKASTMVPDRHARSTVAMATGCPPASGIHGLLFKSVRNKKRKSLALLTLKAPSFDCPAGLHPLPLYAINTQTRYCKC